MAVKKEIRHDQQAEFEGRSLPRKRGRGNLKAYHIRLYESDYTLLKEHFEDEGITISAGVRQALRLFMKDKGIA